MAAISLIFWLRYAITSAHAQLVMKAINRPECVKRTVWVVQFDRSMDHARRMMALERG
jgi:hypothetical protein